MLITTGSLRLVHLHIIVTTFLALALFLLVFALSLLEIDLLAAGFRNGVVVDGRSSSLLATGHFGVLALGGRTFESLGLLLLFLLGTVLVAVCNALIGLGLVRGELWGSRLFRIPVDVSSCLECISLESYHLMAKRVTRGFSARMLLRTFSMTGLAGGSSARASSVYSLFT